MDTLCPFLEQFYGIQKDDLFVQKDAWYDTANSRSCYMEYPAFHKAIDREGAESATITSAKFLT